MVGIFENIWKASVVAAEGMEEHSKVRKITPVKVSLGHVTHGKVFEFCV